jgi:uncharacterized membrane protein
MDASPVAAARPAPRAAPGPFAGRTTARAAWPLLPVAALTVVGLVLRVVVAGDSLFADEYSTYWIVVDHGLGGVLSTVHSNAEITPPLYFVLSWATAKLGHSPELLRLPSLIAGVVTIPAVFALGERTVGRTAALVATALTTLSPFMIFYSAEARGYGLMMALVVVSTLALLLAVDSGRRRWWVLYAACSLGAAYSHYTCFFVLLAQLAWVLWAHPEARKAAIVANVVAAIGFLPWISGLHNDLTSPTSQILSALSPFNLASIRSILGHWAFGYPYASVPLGDLPGAPALIALALALVVGALGLALAVRAGRASWRPDRLLGLILLLALSVPVGEALVSLVSTNLFGVRNLAASWPYLGLAFAALLVAAGPRLRVLAIGLAVAAFGVSAVKMLESRYERPDYAGATDYVKAHAAPGDVVIDETAVLSPGPVSAVDVALTGRGFPLVRGGAPAERDHPFGFADPNVPVQAAIDQAVKVAGGRRVFLVRNLFPESGILEQRREQVALGHFPPPYRQVAHRDWPGLLNPVEVRVYAAR